MLFDHKGRKLELTPQGEIFYVEARKALNSVEEAKEKTKNHAAEFSGKISLAAPALPALFLSAELCPLPRRIPCHQIKYSGQEPRPASRWRGLVTPIWLWSCSRTLLSISRRFR